MFVRSMAFVTRSLRQESRLISHYIMRGVLALFILMLFCITLSGSGMRTGAGAEFVFSIVWCSLRLSQPRRSRLLFDGDR